MKKLKAVVIDDLDWCRELLTEILEEKGYAVRSYAQAETFPFCSDPTRPCQSSEACADLLLTDNRMPNLTGLEMVAQQRARGCKLCQGKRAVISGSWTGAERGRAHALGCHVLEKPFNLKGLQAWLQQGDGCHRGESGGMPAHSG